MNKLLEKFLMDLEFRSKSKETYNRYRYLVQNFITFTKKEDGYNKDDIVSYSVHLKRNGCCDSYRRTIFYVLKIFYQSNKLLWDFRSKEAPPESTPVTPDLSQSDAFKILSLSKKKPRDYAILRLAIILGLRRIEIRNLDRKDFRPPEIYIDTAKRGNPRIHNLDAETVSILNNYLSKRTDNFEPMFISKNKKRFSLVALSNVFTKYKDFAGVKGDHIGMHSIRRGVVTWLYNSGMREAELKQHLGWKSPEMVTRYIQLHGNKATDDISKRIHPFLRNQKQIKK